MRLTLVALHEDVFCPDHPLLGRNGLDALTFFVKPGHKKSGWDAAEGNTGGRVGEGEMWRSREGATRWVGLISSIQRGFGVSNFPGATGSQQVVVLPHRVRTRFPAGRGCRR